VLISVIVEHCTKSVLTTYEYMYVPWESEKSSHSAYSLHIVNTELFSDSYVRVHVNMLTLYNKTHQNYNIKSLQ
jgi:hypothetical protein